MHAGDILKYNKTLGGNGGTREISHSAHCPQCAKKGEVVSCRGDDMCALHSDTTCGQGA